ncbi:uncharacterized protein AC631_00774 [Debaryomyces fabryi]|uniref:DNA-directed RNA polymerase III subunit RPC5 n=1 Tax=Debaryomyces fabryi TaxID=58627 RepID=A0A0V1Q4S3_9ASCO|nr:uncharacterized protein AC631_00774 [Debaryomyces fabryi]KSA03458.1 hypothetical protein AC631_00774 [Debaryomyces fabryi]CUM53685.1 unnamed protein product [Debaryomyces fabryi]
MAASSTSNNALFVEEDDQMNIDSDSDSPVQFHEAYEEQPYDDDPIVESIPLIMNELPDRSKQSLHILQYMGRPKARNFSNEFPTVSVKEESNYLEVRVPLDTQKFYDESRTEEWGAEVTEHSLQGVLNKTNGGLYAGQLLKDDDGNRKIVLIPVDSTAQLRPSFKYLDDLEASKLAQRRADVLENQKPSNIQILQTSAKTNAHANSGDGFANHTLGESLKHVKKFTEEEWSSLQWVGAENNKTQEYKDHLNHGADGIELTTETNMSDYIDALTQY